MNESIFIIRENGPLVPGVFRMTLSGDTSAITTPGQFVNVAIPGKFLRRPISVHDVTENLLTLIYKVVGDGTEEMSRMPAGQELSLLTGLGNGYDLSCAGERPLLIGGGVGVPPLYLAARRLIEAGRKVTVILGFNRAEEVFCEEAFLALGCEVIVTTVDGSRGIRGFVTDAMNLDYTHFYACGPMPMLRAVYRASVTDGQFSFEERMGCGFGACMGCTCKTTAGNKRICKEGPVLRKEEILWES